MYTIIILVSVGILFGLIMFFKYKITDSDIFLGVLSLSIIFGLVLALTLPSKTKYESIEYKIVSLQDNSTTTGNFFLGSGYINGNMSYVFYYKTDDGIKMNIINYRDVTVKYNDNPKIEIINKVVDNKKLINKFSACISCGFDKAIIYIPRGTIKQNYSLDGK